MARGTNRERRKRVRAPARRTDNMTEPADRIERSIERRAADRVVDDVEATPAGVYGNVVFDRHLTIVDCNRAKPLDESLAAGRYGREYLGAEAPPDFASDLANAAAP